MKKIVLLSVIFFLLLSSIIVSAEEKCIYVFYGQGCPHCEQVFQYLDDLTQREPDLKVEKFEVYTNSDNLEKLKSYFSYYNVPESRRGVPVVFLEDIYYVGDVLIINNLESELSRYDSLECPVVEDDVDEDFTLAKIVSLAVVDAINPCALAVLTLMLVAILTYNPKKKRNVLLAGLAFSVSVFVMYMVYGLVIIRFIQVIQALSSMRTMLYSALAVVAILLGLLNLKDYIRYTPGGLGTEMPMFMRPKVKKLISGVTSPSGAFIVGLFVTLFLLPCTIGPYFIAGGILSTLEVIQTIPWLLLYNLIFIVPMLIITFLIYIGMSHVQDVSSWKENNIRQLHLISGLILFFLGIAMLFGWA